MEPQLEQPLIKIQMEPLSATLFDKICRSCLCSEELAHIFEVTYEDTNLCEIFKNCVAIEVERSDNLPQNICKSCIAGLVQIYTFKQQCHQSNALLRAVLNEHNWNASNQSDVKEEAIAEEQVKETNCKKGGSLIISNISVPNLRPRRNGNSKTVKHASNTKKTQVGVKQEDQIPQSDESPIEESLTSASIKTKALSKPDKCPASLHMCKHCNESFDSFNKLKAHRRHAKHPRPRNYMCPQCYKPFSYSHLQQHMRTHTKEKPFRCHVCQMQFSLNCNLRRHMMTHTGERPHTCDICGKGFIQATTLAEHKRTHTGETPYICSYCGMSFGRSGRHKAHLRKHLIENGDFDKLMGDNECSVCHRFFATKGVLKTHMLIHGEKTFLCSHCGKGFVSNAGLLSHMKIHTGVRPYPCTVCSKAFSQLGSLKSHVLIHTGQKPFTCKVCSKAFTQRNHLKYHMRTHSGERPYICSYCGKSFALNGTLTIHIRTHTGETPYVCDICSKGFYDSSSMKKHKKGHGQLDTKNKNVIRIIQNEQEHGS